MLLSISINAEHFSPFPPRVWLISFPSLPPLPEATNWLLSIKPCPIDTPFPAYNPIQTVPALVIRDAHVLPSNRVFPARSTTVLMDPKVTSPDSDHCRSLVAGLVSLNVLRYGHWWGRLTTPRSGLMPGASPGCRVTVLERLYRREVRCSNCKGEGLRQGLLPISPHRQGCGSPTKQSTLSWHSLHRVILTKYLVYFLYFAWFNFNFIITNKMHMRFKFWIF